MFNAARQYLRFLFAVIVGLGSLMGSASAALLVTTTDGNLIFQALSGRGDTSNQEFGIGTPAIGSLPFERQVIFTLHLYRDSLDSVTPAATVNMGYFAAGSALDFYQISDYYGSFWAFSSNVGSARTLSDITVFSDPDNSLGFGGSVVEVLGVDDWVLHLDDAASFAFDDDDNELLIRVFVDPVHRQIPEPTTLALVTACLATLWLSRRLPREQRHDQRTRLNVSSYGWKATAAAAETGPAAGFSPMAWDLDGAAPSKWTASVNLSGTAEFGSNSSIGGATPGSATGAFSLAPFPSSALECLRTAFQRHHWRARIICPR